MKHSLARLRPSDHCVCPGPIRKSNPASSRGGDIGETSISHLSYSHRSTGDCSHQPCTAQCPHHSSDHILACHRSTCAEHQMSTCMRDDSCAPLFAQIHMLSDYNLRDRQQACMGAYDSFPPLHVLYMLSSHLKPSKTPCDGQQTYEGLFCTSASLKKSVCRYRTLVWTLSRRLFSGPQPLCGVRNWTSESMVIGPVAVWPCRAVAPW